MERALHDRFAGIDRLYGRGSVERLARAHVCVVGVGGVGSWAVEALARTAVGRLTLIDADDLCLSNTSRQLPALEGQYGRAKVEAMAERARAIHPAIAIDARQQFLTVSNLEDLLARDYDVVIDACDSLRVKVEAIAFCRRRKIPLIVCGSAGGRTDPTKVQVRDLSRTEHDAMLALVRKRLRTQHGFPRNPDRYFGVQAVYSLENVHYPQPDGTVCGVRPRMSPDEAMKLDCGQGLGSVTQVTGTFAFATVARAVAKILGRK
jgi:tRNA A37 threonylcarbamoyladenosine dehydratase